LIRRHLLATHSRTWMCESEAALQHRALDGPCQVGHSRPHAIFLAKTVSPPVCLQAELLGNRTLQTGLAELASEAAGRNVSYPLTFRTPSGTPAVNTQAGGSASDGEVTPVRLLIPLGNSCHEFISHAASDTHNCLPGFTGALRQRPIQTKCILRMSTSITPRFAASC
jgi:hypothetical protein